MKTSNLIATAVATALILGIATASLADTRTEINAEVAKALVKFHGLNSANESLGRKAAGTLIFPEVTKGGVGVAGEYGEGALQVNGTTVGYYTRLVR